VPFDDPAVDRLLAEQPFFVRDELPADVYPGVPAVNIVEVGAQWVTAADVDEETVYGITRALWHPTTQAVLDNNHPRGREIRVEDALRGLAIPVHPGALRYYREIGLVDGEGGVSEAEVPPDTDEAAPTGHEGEPADSRGLDAPDRGVRPGPAGDVEETGAVRVPNPFVDAFRGGG